MKLIPIEKTNAAKNPVTVFYRFFIFYVFGNGWIVICNFAFELFVTFLKIA
jgi:hypothetical protein